ncbi:hypothetical protein [Thalassotalea agariperforans]
MNNHKLHLWLILNLSFLALYYFYGGIFEKLLIVFLLLFSLLIKSKEQIKQEYTSPIPKWILGLTLIIVLGWIFYLFTREPNYVPPKIEEDRLFSFITLAIVVLLVYVNQFKFSKNST